jgi:hypothetical protein
MNPRYDKNTASEIHATQIMTVESDGFCICPYCFHLVFDEHLSGTCPCCQRRFCPSCSIKKRQL